MNVIFVAMTTYSKRNVNMIISASIGNYDCKQRKMEVTDFLSNKIEMNVILVPRIGNDNLQ